MAERSCSGLQSRQCGFEPSSGHRTSSARTPSARRAPEWTCSVLKSRVTHPVTWYHAQLGRSIQPTPVSRCRLGRPPHRSARSPAREQHPDPSAREAAHAPRFIVTIRRVVSSFPGWRADKRQTLVAAASASPTARGRRGGLPGKPQAGNPSFPALDQDGERFGAAGDVGRRKGWPSRGVPVVDVVGIQE